VDAGANPTRSPNVISADAVPGDGDLPGSQPAADGPFFSPREIYLLLLTVVLAVASYMIGGYPLGYLRFPCAIYWIVMGVRYLQATRPQR
jgi:hypothetical protein